MARGVNKVILVGNLGQSPDVRFLPDGTATSQLSVATDESYKDRNTGDIVPKVEWHRVVCFGRLAEITRDYLKKGSKVYIEGRLATRKWTDKEGVERYTTEIKAAQLLMLDGRPSDDDQSAPPAAQHHPGPKPSPMADNPTNHATTGHQPSPVDDFDDDIPF